jgi:hypothetical protein
MTIHTSSLETPILMREDPRWKRVSQKFQIISH